MRYKLSVPKSRQAVARKLKHNVLKSNKKHNAYNFQKKQEADSFQKFNAINEEIKTHSDNILFRLFGIKN